MRSAVCLIAAMLVAPLAQAADGDIGEALRKFGIIGSWATECAQLRPPLRLIVAAPPGDEPVYTTINSDAGRSTTVRSHVQSAVLLSPRQLRLRLRIFGGDVDGGPLPSPTTNTFEQTFEKVSHDELSMIGSQPLSLHRCAA